MKITDDSSRVFRLLRIACLCLTAVTCFGLPSLVADEAAAEAPVLPVFRMSGMVIEKPAGDDDLAALLGGGGGTSIKSLIDDLHRAAADEDVPAVVLLSDTMLIGRAQQQELIAALNKVREAGKKIHVHGDGCTTGQYVLMTAADEISVSPTGTMFITGIYGEQLFIRGLLEKVGVTPDFATCGDYKSAAEMFMRREPSAEAAEMTAWLYDSIFDAMISQIAAGRDVDHTKARAWIDEGVYTAESALKAGLIDHAEHRQAFESRLRGLYGEDAVFRKGYGRPENSAPDLSTPFGVMNFYAELLSPPKKRDTSKPSVAVVYLEGTIMPGSGGASPFGGSVGAFSEDLRKTLDQAAEDESIKAVVLRVNSPGGSAVASEIILNATARVAEKKPLVISMGDVAGSGGYYVTCASDTIFVSPSTITGSIGVVSGKFSTTRMWNDLGIHWSPVQRGRNAALLSSAGVFSESEKAAMQGYMDEVYEVFRGHVTRARGERLKKPIDELAGGRVFTGEQAIELGLADKIGGLHDAVAYAARSADIADDYQWHILPRQKNLFELMMEDLGGGRKDLPHLAVPLDHAAMAQIAALLKTVDPQRARLLLTAFSQMSILHNERVSLTMPLLQFED